MKAIFDAIRRQKPALAAAHAYAFQQFEFSNRGHSHQLNELGRLAAKMSFGGASDKQAYSRRWTLYTTAQQMLTGYLSGATELLADETWKEIRCAQDETGLLQSLTLKHLRDWATFDLARDFGKFRIDLSACKWEDGQFTATLKLNSGRKTTLTASRLISLSCEQPNTLSACRSLAEKAKKLLRKTLEAADTWPEFAPAVEQSQFERETLDKLRQLIKQNFNAQQQEWLQGRIAFGPRL